MKKVTFTSVLIVLLTGGISFAKYSGGTGEPNDPYRIVTPNDLNDIGNHIEDFNKCFVMANDINLAAYTGTQFNIIGNFSERFTGLFDGNECTIANFTYACTGRSYVGLFCYIGSGGEVRNLVMTNVTVSTTDYATGTLAGQNDGVIWNCCAFGNVTGQDNCTGGLVGSNEGTISNSYTMVTVDGQDESGGLVGQNGGTILRCHSMSDVEGTEHSGGLVGWHDTGDISACFSTGDVVGHYQTGGLIGILCSGGITHCYAVGGVTATAQYLGGLVGYQMDGSYESCFWNTNPNPDLNGIGNTIDPNVIGKTTAEMQTESTFTDAGWDFVEVWDIGENQTYPFLRVYPAGDLNHSGLVDWRDYAILAGHWLEGIEQ